MCDMDGVLYRGDEAIAGAAAAVDRLRAAGIRLAFCTNNSRSTPDQYLAKLDRLGFMVEPSELLTSAMVTARVLVERGATGARAFVVGGEGLRDALGHAGLEVVGPDAVDVDVVVVGWDPSFDYEAMRAASRAVLAGASFLASNDDAAFPAPDGLLPGAGAILASIERASGRRAEVIGKPNEPTMNAVSELLGDAQDVVAVGDRFETDLEGARRRGWATVLVLSGVTSADQAGVLDPAPDLILDSIAELPDQYL